MTKSFIFYAVFLCGLLMYCNSRNQVFMGALWVALLSDDDSSYNSGYRGYGGGGYHK